MMWFLQKDFRFEASHRLVRHDGKCARLHGHSWKGTVIVAGDRLQTYGPKAGMVVDFGDVKTVLDPLVDEFLDHRHLNGTLELQDPTSEAIAQWVFDRLIRVLPSLVGVVIEETCTTRCVYMPTEDRIRELLAIPQDQGGT